MTAYSPARKLVVCGFPGSGKSTFFRLLDGHPQILGTQLHEKYLDMFTAGAKDLEAISERQKLRLSPRGASHSSFPLQWKDKTVRLSLAAFRKLLTNHSYYHLIETEAMAKATYNSFSSQESLDLSFNFDFVRFEHNWKFRIFDGMVQTPESIIDILYQSFFDAWTDCPVHYSPDTYLAFCLQTYPYLTDFIFKEHFNAKMVYIDRDIEGTVATHYLRFKLAQKETGDYYRIDKSKLLQVARRRHREREHILRLAQEHPIFIIRMEDFVMDTQATMDRVADFIGISRDPILYRPTHLGHPLEGEYLGKINDNWQEVLSKGDLGVIRYLEGRESFLGLGLKYGAASAGEVAKIEIKDCAAVVLSAVKKAVSGLKAILR